MRWYLPYLMVGWGCFFLGARFKFYDLKNGHVACVSRGPPEEAITSFREVLPLPHVPSSPLTFGLESIQPRFEHLKLRNLLPRKVLVAYDASVADKEEEEEPMVFGFGPAC